MFELAYGLALQARGRQVCYDKSFYTGNTFRKYSLGAFNTPLLFSSPESPKIWEKSLRYDESLLDVKFGTVIGYFQSEKYFDSISHIVRREFVFRESLNREYAMGMYQEICSTPNSIALHVRRQDYVALQQFHGLVPLGYYNEGIARIRATYPDSQVFVFSDDINWCIENVEGSIVLGTTEYEDMQLMAACQHAVIANSSFSWWGAWLGDNKPDRVVVAPQRWFTDPNMDSTDIVPDRWVRL